MSYLVFNRNENMKALLRINRRTLKEKKTHQTLFLSLFLATPTACGNSWARIEPVPQQ